MKAVYKDHIVADSDETVIVEENHYFPRESVRMEFLKNKDEAAYTCPWKGVCDYYDVEVDGELIRTGAWIYEQPKEAAKKIAGFVAFFVDKGIEVVE